MGSINETDIMKQFTLTKIYSGLFRSLHQKLCWPIENKRLETNRIFQFVVRITVIKIAEVFTRCRQQNIMMVPPQFAHSQIPSLDKRDIAAQKL